MTDVERAVARWHAAVNGPWGAGPLAPAEFADWVARSGITMRAVSHHPVGDRVLVVEQEVRWPASPGWTEVATVFRLATDGTRVSAALRFPDLAALAFARLYAALAGTEDS
jgi:hypothetical protein